MSHRHEAMNASIPGHDSQEPVGSHVIAITNVRHPDHDLDVTLRIYGPEDWNGEVAFTQTTVSVDDIEVSPDNIRRGWTKAGDE
jgi:hypothetical protein